MPEYALIPKLPLLMATFFKIDQAVRLKEKIRQQMCQ
jgi:hypothetical protein